MPDHADSLVCIWSTSLDSLLRRQAYSEELMVLRPLFGDDLVRDLEDKEVTFHSVIGRMTVEDKFDLKKMTRSGRLELD